MNQNKIFNIILSLLISSVALSALSASRYFKKKVETSWHIKIALSVQIIIFGFGNLKLHIYITKRVLIFLLGTSIPKYISWNVIPEAHPVITNKNNKTCYPHKELPQKENNKCKFNV